MPVVHFFLAFFVVAQDDSTQRARALVEKLRSEKVEDREDASGKLKELGRGALPELEKAARESDREVTDRANLLIRRLELLDLLSADLKKALPGIEDRLAAGDDNEWTIVLLEGSRTDAFRGLTAAQLDPLLSRALAGTRTETELDQVSSILVDLNCKTSVPDLRRVLMDPARPPSTGAVMALRALCGKAGIPDFTKLLSHKEGRIRARAVESLGEVDSKESIPELRKLLADADAGVRGSAASVLSLLGARDSAREIAALLRDPDEGVRSQAANSLGWLSYREAASDVARLVGDSSTIVRVSIAEALGDLADRKTAKDLGKLLADADSDVQMAAIRSLSEVDPETLLEATPRLLKEPSPYVHGAVILALGTAGQDQRFVPFLSDAMGNEQTWIRALAAESSASIPAADSESMLIGLLSDKDPWVRSSAASALSWTRSEKAVPHLRKLLEDESRVDEPGERSANPYLLVKILRPGGGWDASSEWDYPPLGILVAQSLCRSGVREAAGRLVAKLDEYPDCLDPAVLNAIRRPDAWLRFSGARLRRGLQGKLSDVLAKISALTGHSVEHQEVASGEGHFYLTRSERLPVSLKSILSYSNETYVLESDRVRILPRSDAVKFWRVWWAEGQSEEKK